MKTKLFTLILLCIFGAECAKAQTTQFWGTTEGGGANGDGVIFTMDGNGANYHVEYSFTDPTGRRPAGNVVLANNGKLYGITFEGGFGDSCVIYSYEPSTGIYTKVYDFYQYTQYGWLAQSGMIKATNGMLYGLCTIGGANDGGVIFKVDPSTDTYTDIYDFDGINGGSPLGSLIQLSNGKLYGMTFGGGTNGDGVIFSFDPVNFTFTKLFDFNMATGGNPYFDGLIQATNSKVYGMTLEGGANNLGVLFSFDFATGIYTDLFDFDGTHGRHPTGSVMQASNGLLYGMASGGANNDGVLFSFDVTSNILTDLLDFDGTNGAGPQRGLTQGSNGKLFGVTMGGGIVNGGVAFSYDIMTNNYTKLYDFGTMGYYPDCGLVETPVLTPTGIPAIVAANEGGVYPNPATSSLTVTGTLKDEVVRFIDVAGKELLSLKVIANSKTGVDISRFPNMFFMKRQNGEVSKIVRE